MKNLKFALAWVFILACSLSSAQVKILDKIIAIVDDDVALQTEINRRMSSKIKQIKQ